MIDIALILNTSERQKKEILDSDKRLSVPRVSAAIEQALPQFARIITGIRRSGKSTLVNQDFLKDGKNAFYLNFDDPALYGFSSADFTILEEAIGRFQKANDGTKSVYFDEIQVVEGWEVFVNAQLRKKNLVTVTGSNASLLSSELGSRLTGRHLDYELFPFSYEEFCLLKKCKKTAKTFSDFLKYGGFPEYLIYNRPEILKRLFEDILMRDVVVRYGIKDVRSIKLLSLCLASNCGNLISGSKLSAQLGLKTTATILEYLSFLGNKTALYACEPVRKINDPDTFILISIMACSCDKHFRICILNRQQWRYLALKCLVIGDVIGYLDIFFFTAFYHHEIYLFFI